MNAFKADPVRYEEKERWETGIFVRATNPDGKWESLDVSVLTKESLLDFLRSRGQENSWAENVVGILLGHGHLV